MNGLGSSLAGTLVAKLFLELKEETSVIKKLSLALAIGGLLGISVSCTHNDAANSNANENANATAQTTTRPGPDNSEITTTTDSQGVTTETRVFRNNPRISRVVVTTHDGKRTAKAYTASGEEKPIEKVEDALEATGDKVADGAGFVADKTEDVAGEAKHGAEKVADKTEDVAGEAKHGAEKVGRKTVDTAETVGDKTVSGAKTVTKKTTEGVKKAGSKVKDAITP
jgi:hypothetical protein